jgi:hypothetical protein
MDAARFINSFLSSILKTILVFCIVFSVSICVNAYIGVGHTHTMHKMSDISDIESHLQHAKLLTTGLIPVLFTYFVFLIAVILFANWIFGLNIDLHFLNRFLYKDPHLRYFSIYLSINNPRSPPFNF